MVQPIDANDSKSSKSNKSGTTPPVNPQQPQQAVSLSDLLGRFTRTTSLTPAALEFIENVRGEVGNKFPGIQVNAIGGPDFELRTFHIEGRTNCVVVVLSEATFSTDLPITDPARLRGVVDRVSNAIKCGILDVITIRKEDYALWMNLAARINNLLTLDIGPDLKLANVQSFRSARLVVTQDIAEVRKFVKRISPLAVNARDDIGFVVSIVEDLPGTLDPITRKPQTARSHLFAVTGFTQFIHSAPQNAYGAAQTKFLPVVRITGIQSLLPIPGLIGAAIGMAAKVFIGAGGWLRPYSTFRAGDQNLGMLATDQTTGKPAICKNLAERNSILVQLFDKPYLAIDLDEGGAGVYGMGNMAQNDAELFNAIQSFMGIQAIPNIPLVCSKWTEYSGVVSVNHEDRDLRCVDYMHLIGQVPDPAEVVEFLTPAHQPRDRVLAVRQHYTDVTLTGKTTVTVIHLAYADQMIGILNGFSIVYEGEDNRPIYDVSNLMRANANVFVGGGTAWGSNQNMQGQMGGLYARL